MSQSPPVALRDTLQEAERFIAGFEDDESQQPFVSTLLAKLRAQIALAPDSGKPATEDPATYAARQAILHVLHRIRNDPRLAYHFDPITRSMELLTKAHALLLGMDLEQFRKDYYGCLRFEGPACKECGGAA